MDFRVFIFYAIAIWGTVRYTIPSFVGMGLQYRFLSGCCRVSKRKTTNNASINRNSEMYSKNDFAVLNKKVCKSHCVMMHTYAAS